MVLFHSHCRTYLYTFAALLCHLAAAFAFRLTGQAEQRLFNEILIYGAAAFAVTWALWKYHRSYLLNFSFILLLHLLSVYLLKDFSNNGFAASDAMEWGTILFSMAALPGLAAVSAASRAVKTLWLVLYYAGMSITAAIPLIGLGYGFISGGNALSSDLVLAVCQTNPREAIEFLEEQPLSLWCLALFALLLFLALEIFLSRRMLQNAVSHKWVPLLIAASLLALNIRSTAPRLHAYYLANTIVNTRRSLDSYKAYRLHQKERLARLRELTGLRILPEAKGTYVLVIGETASRDHMHTYGYPRENTPWMDAMADKPGTVIFRKAYANYCQTIPALTYALSGKNQYNQVKLEEAYSLIDIARAAGYDTYWLSNQSRFSAVETPVSEMASTADHQSWINGRSSSSTRTTYPDGELLSYLPDPLPDKPALIVLHIMGGHEKYADRYPKEFAVYKGKGRLVDGYDDTVLYVDTFLKKVFARARQYPHFKGFVYIPDHGENPEEGRTHQPDKFTYQMVHIPMLLCLSEDSIASRPELYAAAQAHRDSPWTNDLTYDMMVDLLGIQDAPFASSSCSILSPEYGMTRKQLRTQHGALTFDNDPDDGLESAKKAVP